MLVSKYIFNGGHNFQKNVSMFVDGYTLGETPKAMEGKNYAFFLAFNFPSVLTFMFFTKIIFAFRYVSEMQSAVL